MGETFNDILGALIDGLDSLALGIPSSILLRDVSEQYKVDYAKVQDLYAQLNTLINAMGIERDKVAEHKASLLAESRSYAPMSGLKNSLMDEYAKLDDKEASLTAKISSLSDQAQAAANEANNIAAKMSNSLGTEAKQRLLE